MIVITGAEYGPCPSHKWDWISNIDMVRLTSPTSANSESRTSKGLKFYVVCACRPKDVPNIGSHDGPLGMGEKADRSTRSSIASKP